LQEEVIAEKEAIRLLEEYGLGDMRVLSRFISFPPCSPVFHFLYLQKRKNQGLMTAFIASSLDPLNDGFDSWIALKKSSTSTGRVLF